MKQPFGGGADAQFSADRSERKYQEMKVADGKHEGWDGISFETKDEEIISLTLKNGKVIKKGDTVRLTVASNNEKKTILVTTKVLSITVADPWSQAQEIRGSRTNREMINDPDIKPTISLWTDASRGGEHIPSHAILDAEVIS